MAPSPWFSTPDAAADLDLAVDDEQRALFMFGA